MLTRLALPARRCGARWFARSAGAASSRPRAVVKRRGFTITELLVALAIVGVVAGAAFRGLWASQRAYLRQMERVALQENLRAAAVILPSELQELNAADARGSDLLMLADSAVTFKAPRSLYTLCNPPQDFGGSGVVTVWRAPWYGLREIVPDRDSALVFAEGDTTLAADDDWVHADVATVTAGNECPGGRASLAITLGSIDPPGGLAGVRTGAALRSYELRQLAGYRDARGDWWLGLREFNQRSGWGAIQPTLGPLAVNGLRFAYLDRDGGPATDPSRVARILVTVIGRSAHRARLLNGSVGYIQDTLRMDITPRGTPRMTP